jgi:hypothetical protein
MSYGTFEAELLLKNSLVIMEIQSTYCPDPNEDPWPKQLSIGSGAQTIALLNTVPVWFEIYV